MLQKGEGWNELLSEIRYMPGVKTVYVVGASDRGKTTFCRFLWDALIQDQPTAYIDCDPGQSSIGPPSCIGMRSGIPPGPDEGHIVLSFVGALSPEGHLLQNLCGAKKLVQKAVALGCSTVILDSSGFVMGSAAREFQFNVIDLIRPEFLVAFQIEKELEGLLQNFTGSMGMKIRRLPVSGAVRERSPQARQAYRTERFRNYFRDAKTQIIRVSGKGLHGAVPGYRLTGSCENLLIALCDPENFVTVLAVIESYSSKARALEVFAPPFDEGKVNTVQFGSIRLDRDFRMIRRPRG